MGEWNKTFVTLALSKRVDEGRIITVKDLERWLFSVGPFVRANDEGLTPETSASPSFHGDNSTFVNLFDKTKIFVTLKTAASLSFCGGNLILINLFEFHISTEAAPQFLRNKCTYQLLPLRSPPRGTHGHEGGMVQFWCYFFPRRGGKFYSFGNNFSGSRGRTHGICFRFGQHQSFSAPCYFISMPHFDIMLWAFILPPRKVLFVIIFMPLTQGLWIVFFCHEKRFPAGIPGVDPRGSKW